jgi:hypothetical protein
VVDEDAAHDLRGDGEELRAVLPGDVLPVNQPQVSLVDERRGLQGLGVALVLEVRGGQPPQLVVDQFEQLRGRLPIARAHGVQ